MKLLAILIAGLFVSTPALAIDFETGQRWSCVTDQGADAYTIIHDVVGDDVVFSWGVVDADSNEVFSLCNQSDALSADEMSDFCSLLGDEFSQGHVLLQKGCAE